MSTPTDYKTAEEIAVELHVPIGRVQAAINALGIPSQSFPPDRRRRYYAPKDVERIAEVVSNK